MVVPSYSDFLRGVAKPRNIVDCRISNIAHFPSRRETEYGHPFIQIKIGLGMSRLVSGCKLLLWDSGKESRFGGLTDGTEALISIPNLFFSFALGKSGYHYRILQSSFQRPEEE